MSNYHDPKEKKRELIRLKKVIGQLEFVKRLIDKDADCCEVLIQISAAQSALNGLRKQIITQHVDHCLTQAVENEDYKTLEEFKKTVEKFI